MEPKLQRRLQRSGWDLAAPRYEPLWLAPLAPAHEKMLSCAALVPGEHVLDVACGSGVVSLAAADLVGRNGRVVGVDLSGRMVDVARVAAFGHGLQHASFRRMDAEALDFPDASFDVVLCALGLMYVPDPLRALREMRRVLKPGGRLVVSVWGDRAACGWASVFDIVDAEVAGEVCPLFFALGQGDALATSCAAAGVRVRESHRVRTVLAYEGVNDACAAAFVAGPVALAWSRFDDATRERVCEKYVASIEPWRTDRGFGVPGEFVVVSAWHDGGSTIRDDGRSRWEPAAWKPSAME